MMALQSPAGMKVLGKGANLLGKGAKDLLSARKAMRSGLPLTSFENVPLVNPGQIAKEREAMVASMPSQERLRRMMGENYTPVEEPNASQIKSAISSYAGGSA